ncbi:MAG TPA: hypothetical protein VFI27_04975 [candidate division Zixibacteria bacterium]|nr:hypothetical protein [candidate division Zixibacteria bacterium]
MRGLLCTETVTETVIAEPTMREMFAEAVTDIRWINQWMEEHKGRHARHAIPAACKDTGTAVAGHHFRGEKRGDFLP